jgi:hypothetical protein
MEAAEAQKNSSADCLGSALERFAGSTHRQSRVLRDCHDSALHPCIGALIKAGP